MRPILPLVQRPPVVPLLVATADIAASLYVCVLLMSCIRRGRRRVGLPMELRRERRLATNVLLRGQRRM